MESVDLSESRDIHWETTIWEHNAEHLSSSNENKNQFQSFIYLVCVCWTKRKDPEKSSFLLPVLLPKGTISTLYQNIIKSNPIFSLFHTDLLDNSSGLFTVLLTQIYAT